MQFDASLKDEEIKALQQRSSMFRSAFFDRPLMWWADRDTSNDRILCVSDTENPQSCLGRFYLQELLSIQDEDEFCLQIITGAYSK